MDIETFKNRRILVAGDLMIDEYLWGEVDRISPEAPVQVVAVQREDFTLGGAGNVVSNLVALGATVSVAGVIGAGGDGGLLSKKLHALGVDVGGIVEEPDRHTTRKTRIIAANQHVLRIDRESRKPIANQTARKLSDFLKSKIPEVDVILVSDYGKGVVVPSVLSILAAEARRFGKMSIADPKGLDFKKYAGLSVLTPNKKEAAAAAGMEIQTDSDLIAAGNRILRSVPVDALLITCGKDGMVLFEGSEASHTIRAEARQVFDVSGAGDTVLAVLGLAVAAGASLREAATLANTAAGIVVGKVGTATVSPAELATALQSRGDGTPLKEKQIPELAELSQKLKRQGKRIVLTNGCFDLLHTGHIGLFSASKKLGDVLVVAIDDDRSVRKLKGAGRPVLKARERARMLSALDSVDYVVVFSSGELETVIETLEPAVLTKGSNYTSDRVFGREIVERIGGQVVLIPVIEDISSSRIIDSIKNSDKR